jgi:succinoglycan biosynthesis transport protein ExoP
MIDTPWARRIARIAGQSQVEHSREPLANNETEDRLDLSSFITAVRAALLPIILLIAVAAGLAFVASAQLTPSYEAETRLFVGSLTNANYDQGLAYQQLAQTYGQLATTTPVLQKVIDGLGLKDDPETLQRRISVRTPTDQSFIRITASAPTADAAAKLANAVADQITALGKGSGSGDSGLVSVVQPALAPRSPASPRPLLNAVIAGAIGLVIGLGMVVFTNRRRPDTGYPIAS